MSRIKLIASDLDGTLLLNGAQKLQPQTCGLIRRLREEKGILFLAASGRQVDNLERLFAPVKDEIAYLCENGCLCFCGGKKIHQEYMDHSLGQSIIRTIQATEGAEVLLSGVHTSYIQPKDKSYYYHMRDVVGNNVTLVPDILRTEEPYFKVSLYEAGGLHDVSWWQRKFGDRATVVTGGSEWLDCMPRGVNKATALDQILRYLGIAPEEVIAFGDNFNDREMLEMVGVPVAVESAKKEIIRICGRTTDTVEHALERILRDEFPAQPVS